MNLRLSVVALPLASLAFTACTPDLGKIIPREDGDGVLAEFSIRNIDTDVVSAHGLNIDPRSGEFVFLTDRGILHVDKDGAETFRHDTDSIYVQEGNVEDEWGYETNTSTFGDIASLGDGTYAMPMENMVRRYNPETGIAEDFFCLLPGMPMQQMHNDAIALNLEDNEILAAPMITEEDQIVSNNLVSYHASDASFDSSAAIADAQLHPQGIALHKASDRVIAVEGNRAFALDRDGQVLLSAELSGIEDASAATIDADTDTLYVLDRTEATMRAFSLDALTQ